MFLPTDSCPQWQSSAHELFRGTWAVIAPAVALERAGTSLELTNALRTATCVHGEEGPGRVLIAVDHLTRLITEQAPDLPGVLEEVLLAPMNSATKQRRRSLAEILLAWLKWRAAPETARELHVHPQTVRCRLRQTGGLFGAALHRPHMRFALEYALRGLQ
ncbi:hypothetical protein AV521_36830 [Streptomyces sp. IMTB 2501]|uniref:helix-turn-helix domain-containing protein n=1 Tax=Streptomyces sp. IMTB 2501 TaxID=1776340 RepID=UPI00096F38F9|nr:helix-turn-helix domain-containing protein [Streptomyces sp. IMTB 2501]OLZ64095.1 hypothetical protein AV521_36830 [Streptomyces sp. IMTB 2501]